MMIRRIAAAAATIAICAGAAHAQVAVQPLARLDMFSTGVTDTGLGADLWSGASADIARQVVTGLRGKTLSPATAALAKRILRTAATAPEGAGSDADLAGARAQVLLGLGDVEAVNAILDHTANLSSNAALSQAAAEAALLADQDDKACRISDALTAGRDEVYWLRLRAYCQAVAGQTAAAQLTLDLAQQQGRDAVYGELMGALLGGTGAGPAALRNGLDYALSRRLKLDLTSPGPGSNSFIAARLKGPPAPRTVAPPENAIPLALAAIADGDLAGAQAIRAAMVQDQVPGAGVADLPMLDALLATASGKAEEAALGGLVDHAIGAAKPRAEAAAGLMAALGTPMSGETRAAFARFDIGRAETPPARLLTLDLSADAGRKGETALLALSIAQVGGLAGPPPADRARIVRALNRVGLKTDARAFAVEGLLALNRAVPAPPPAAKAARKPPAKKHP